MDNLSSKPKSVPAGVSAVLRRKASGLTKKWIAGAIFGVLANAGVLGAALGTAGLIIVVSNFTHWTVSEQEELFWQTAWIWVPLGWSISARGLLDGGPELDTKFLRDMLGPAPRE